MKVTILGCGPSIGVPIVGCDCEVCTSDNPKNTRLRSSILIEQDGHAILIDTSPDLRQQTLQNNIKRVDAVLYTHEHADHSHGIDEVRNFNRMQEQIIPCYGDQRTINLLKERFGYVFSPPHPDYGWYKAAMQEHVVEPYKPFECGPHSVLPFDQVHGRITTLGFKVGNVAYSTDVNELSDKALETVAGIDLWIVDCQGIKPQYTHSHLEQTLAWIDKAKPKHAILIHMHHDLEYETLNASLPDHIEPAYDGMVIDL